jgi:hypothetical protein
VTAFSGGQVMKNKLLDILLLDSQPRKDYEIFIIGLLLVLVALVIAFIGAAMLVFSEEIPTQFSYTRKILSALGTFLMIGSIVNLTWRILFYPYFQRRENERVTDLYRSELSRLVPKVVVFGLTKIEERMDYGDLFESLQSDDELWWLDTYAPGHMHWRANLERAIARGTQIKMLVLEPDCAVAKLRADEIATDLFPREKFHTELKQFHDEMMQRASVSRNKSFQVAAYNTLLGCPLYLIVRNGRAIKAFSSLYLNPASFDFPHFVWEQSEQPQFLDALEKYVRDKWDHAVNHSTN